MSEVQVATPISPQLDAPFPSPAEQKRGWDVILEEHRRFVPEPPLVLWHYTTAEGLIGIVKSGELYTTHVSCLNDSTELNYAAGLLREAIQRRLACAPPNTPDRILFRAMDDGLAENVALDSPYYVACLSEREDDLSQWRGYGGSDCGYAIGFRSDWLLGVDADFLLPLTKVSYDEADNRALAGRIAAMTSHHFQTALEVRPHRKPEEFADEFVTMWSQLITRLGPAVKHPTFKDEQEWRFVRYLVASDVPNLIFRARKSLITRHLPIRFPPTNNPSASLLPICEIVVGPSRHGETSAQSVRQMLMAKGYGGNVRVRVSKIPFQSL